jgi:hypothetical protein
VTKDELKDLVTAMRELGVTRFQDGQLMLELAPAAPAPPPEKDPEKPEYQAVVTHKQQRKQLEMLFKHSSLKPFKRLPNEK